MKHIILFIIFVLVLVACGPSGQAVKTGQNVDYIGAVEQRVNGVYFVFGMYDSSNAYCTKNADLANQAKALLKSHILAIVTYSGINSGDPDQATLTGQGCENREGVQVLRLDAIEPLETTQQ